MAVEKQAADKDNSRSVSADADQPVSKEIGRVELAVLSAASIIGSLWNAVMKDGVLAAAGRQGIDEIGAALKAFPDAIQQAETGTVFNPTQGEIAADRQNDKPTAWIRSNSADSGQRQPWPSEIAAANRHLPSKEHGNGRDKGDDAGHSM